MEQNNQLRFIKIDDTGKPAAFLADRLKRALATNNSVLWLIPGGSSIKVAEQAASILSDSDAELSRLTYSLTDERYGGLGHSDSNWKQLEREGLSLPGARAYPVLQGKSADETTSDFGRFLESELAAADYKLGFFGIGPDGHTAGVLPGSPAALSPLFAAHYQAPGFHRITMTPKAIAMLDEAVVYAVGQEKWPIFDMLEKELPVQIQPAQALKKVKTLTIFNDYKGESL